MLIKLWHGGWDNQLERMNMRVVEENGRYVVMGKGRLYKVCQFLCNGFWKNIGCLVLAPTFCIGWSRYGISSRNKI